MSMTLNLEIGVGVKLEDVTQALSCVDNVEITNKGSSLEAYFPNSNVSIWIKTELADTKVLTESLNNVDWKVDMRMYFDIDPTLPNALDEINKFIFALSKSTSAPFVLSFEYDTLYARSDGDGVVLSGGF